MKNIKQMKCKNCKGAGFIPLGEGIKGIEVCPVCKGTGKIETEPKEKRIEELYNIIPASMSDYAKEPMEHAREFMTEE